MKKKIIIATLVPLFILPFVTKISPSQSCINNIHNSSTHIYSPTIIKKIKPDKENNNYIKMKATGYDLSVQCCGKYYINPSRGITKNGYNLNNKSRREVMTISSNKFPIGTKLLLEFSESHKKYNGIYTVRDTGYFKENVLDVYLGDFGEKVGRETIKFGRVDVNVKMIE